MRTSMPERQACRGLAILKSGTPALLVALLSLIIPADLYADTGTWVDGDMPTLSVGEVSTTPPQATGSCFKTTYTYFKYDTSLPNSSGHTIDATGCEMQNSMGSFISSNPNNAGDSYDFIKPGTSIAFRVLRGESRPASIISAPNQSSFFWEEPSNYWGSPVIPHFFSNFAAAGGFSKYATGSGYELAYNLNTNGSLLTDSKGTKLYMHAYAFSQNGAWMVAEIDGTGLVRIDTRTLQTTLFSTTYLAYNLGFGHNLQLAVSDDGNSAIMGHDSSVNTTVFDLSGCQGGPFIAGGTSNNAAISGCRSRVVQGDLQAKLTNFQYLQTMRFSSDGKSISAIAVTTGLNGIKLYNHITYSVAGYQPPHVSYLALGDSFSSGEGAFNYVAGTDNDNPKNKCHVSTLSYPYLTAEALGITDFHSVACSGALYNPNYKSKPEFDGSPQPPLGAWLPGIKRQKDYVRVATQDVITISMIGNDVGFKDKLTTCILGPDDCYHFREDREAVANEFRGKFDDLVALYTDIKNSSGNSNVKVYVLGYPQILGTDNCQLNVRFSLEERQMAQGMIGYLNAIIKAATISAGVQYIDVEHAFDGYRLCDTHTSDPLNLSSAAVNGLTRGDDFGPISNGSFHPNALGHQLMSEALLTQSQNFTKPMPAPDPSVIPPYTGSDAYNNLISDAPSANLPGALLYTSPTTTVTSVSMSAADLVTRGSNLHLTETQMYLQANSQFLVWFHSDPVLAGTLTTDGAGHLAGDVTIPSDLPPGFHTMHVIGKDIGGGDIDMYQVIYVAVSLDDYNGDGIPNSEDPCLIIPPSGADSDHDGIDDACDGDIAPPPADTVPPQVLGVADRLPDHNGWYSHDVTVSWSAVDPDPSSGSPTRPDTTLANLEGDNIYTSGESCDPTGNCATGSLELKLDKTAPDITFTIEPAPNANGWNNSEVVVHFACADALSGIENCTEPIAVSGSDGSYVVTGYATDNAGNASGVNVIVNLDATAPQITNTLSSEPNQYGWHNSGVTVTPSCSDNLSGIATCSQPATIDQEGVTQTVASSATDYAGNTSSVSTTVNIDKTAPTIDSLSWMNNPKATLSIATLSVHAMDNLSGALAAEYFLGDIDPGASHGTPMVAVDGTFTATFGSDLPTGVYRISVRVQDKAGNWSTLTSDYLVAYSPFSTNMTGRKFVVPSFANDDRLPGLATSTQADKASFGFNVGYDAHGQLLHSSGLEFSYATGSDCNKPSKAQNCHSLTLSAGSIAWFVAQGGNNSTGIFEGSGMLAVDGIQQPVNFWVTGVDGERLDATSPDHLQLQIFTPVQNPASDTPIYQINDDVLRGNIHIRA